MVNISTFWKCVVPVLLPKFGNLSVSPWKLQAWNGIGVTEIKVILSCFFSFVCSTCCVFKLCVQLVGSGNCCFVFFSLWFHKE